MRAAVLNAPQTDLVVETVDIDVPRGREVLVRTAYCGVCHSDEHFIEDPAHWLGAPTILGHEAAGVVEAVGPDVTDVGPGDHIITCLSVFCGKCRYCLEGRTNLCRSKPFRAASATPTLTRGDEALQTIGGIGGFAEHMLIHENGLVKIREDMPLDRAALISCGVMTGVGAALNRAKVAPGSSVAVFGTGGIGMSVVQGARIAGAARIIAVDLDAGRLDRARTFGATHTVDASSADAVGEVRELSEGGVDYAFEAVGSGALAAAAFESTCHGGMTVMLGVAQPGATVTVDAAMLRREKVLTGSSMGSNRFKLDMPKYIELYFQGRLLLDEMVTAEFSLDDINQGFEALRRRDGLRSVIALQP